MHQPKVFARIIAQIKAAPAVVADPGAGQTVSPPSGGLAMATARRVLIIDDDPVLLRTVARELTATGWDCSTSTVLVDPKIAPADVYLLDVEPHAETMMVRCKAADPPIPYVLITGNGVEAERLRAAGETVIDKPWRQDEIDSALRAALLDAGLLAVCGVRHG